MTGSALTLRHLSFTGPNKPMVSIEFRHGLNILYGASDTGKSFVLDAIDFMLGGRRLSRSIPEISGFDRALLGIETTADGVFTLTRSLSGGAFELFEGLHRTLPLDLEGSNLSGQHQAGSLENVSGFLLSKIGLYGKLIKVNSSGKTKSLSFRNLCQLCLVSEEQIIKKNSPIESGQNTLKTPELAAFKLLLSGVDDSALVAEEYESQLAQLGAAKMEIVDELLASYREQLASDTRGPTEINNQLRLLDTTITQEQHYLSESEDRFQTLVRQRRATRESLGEAQDRRGEIDGLLARFALLRSHYESDLARLEGIREAGSLLAALAPQTCPLCGAKTEDQHRDSDCDANIEIVVAAADAERMKTARLRNELQDTIDQLQQEARDFDDLIPRLAKNLADLEAEIDTVAPTLQIQRSSYSGLVDKRAALQTTLAIWNGVSDLQKRRDQLQQSLNVRPATPSGSTDILSSDLDKFAQLVRSILVAWDLPESERVHFDEKSRDLVIDGKHRGSRGKGMRAITHAAFTIGLMEYCRQYGTPHPGFVILDSPLLAYREPDGDEDDLRGTDVQEKFYRNLAEFSERQVIVIENLNPPDEIQKRPGITFFSKNPRSGRYGLFPVD